MIVISETGVMMQRTMSCPANVALSVLKVFVVSREPEEARNSALTIL